MAIGVGTGDASLALAITAAKLGVPLVAWVEEASAQHGELGAAEDRILRTLADFDAGPVGDGAAAFEAAERISSWAEPRTWTMKVGIIGMGYVGLPLAVAFAEAASRSSGWTSITEWWRASRAARARSRTCPPTASPPSWATGSR